MKCFYRKIKSPVGILTLVAKGDCLVRVHWETEDIKYLNSLEYEKATKHVVLDKAEKQLREYFEGRRTEFNLPLEMNGTDFQKNVWKSLRRIPYGKTWSYGELAKRVGNKNASRAVGAANGKNPISIIVPCHRVIGADGTLTGFGGGLKAKKILLDLESSK